MYLSDYYIVHPSHMCLHKIVSLVNMVSAGEVPYPGMDMDETFVKTLKAGYRMEKPPHAPDVL